MFIQLNDDKKLKKLEAHNDQLPENACYACT